MERSNRVLVLRNINTLVFGFHSSVGNFKRPTSQVDTASIYEILPIAGTKFLDLQILLADEYRISQFVIEFSARQT